MQLSHGRVSTAIDLVAWYAFIIFVCVVVRLWYPASWPRPLVIQYACDVLMLTSFLAILVDRGETRSD